MHAQGSFRVYDEPLVNDHPGFLTAWAVSDVMDRVIVIVSGYDTNNTKLPIDELTGDYRPLVDFLNLLGWTVVLFDYVDGSIDLRDNADNLARFLEVLRIEASAGFHLAVVGGSMDGIVSRTAFVQERKNLGVDTFV